MLMIIIYTEFEYENETVQDRFQNSGNPEELEKNIPTTFQSLAIQGS